MGSRTVHLGHLSEILEIAYKGIRRAYVFMGLGVNASENESVSDFHIDHGGIQIRSVESLPPDQMKDAKNLFRQWIIGHGFSELLHNYGLFLDRVYSICLVIETVRTGSDRVEAVKRERKFVRSLSIGGKSKALSDEFGIVGMLVAYIHGLNNARNALVHTNGIVSPSHCTHGDVLKVSWRRMVIGVVENGSDLFVPLKKDMFIEKGGEVQMKYEDCEKEFRVGEPVALDATDIHEICALMSFDIQRMGMAMVEYFKKMGVEIREVSQTGSQGDAVPKPIEDTKGLTEGP